MKPCTCKIVFEHNALSGSEGDAVIQYCPFHAAAPELLEMLKTVHRDGAGRHYEAIAELILKAEGQNNA